MLILIKLGYLVRFYPCVHRVSPCVSIYLSRIFFIPRFYPSILSPPFLLPFTTSSLKLTEEILDHSGDSMSINFTKYQGNILSYFRD